MSATLERVNLKPGDSKESERKIAISTSAIGLITLEYAFILAKKLAVDGLEIVHTRRTNKFLEALTAKLCEAYAQKHNITILGVHGPWEANSRTALRTLLKAQGIKGKAANLLLGRILTGVLEKSKTVDLAKAFGAYLNVHPNVAAAMEPKIKKISCELSEYLGQLLIENTPTRKKSPEATFTPRTTLNFVKKLGLSGTLLDVVHADLDGFGLEEAYQDMGGRKWIKAIHLSDLDRQKKWPHNDHLVPGQGNLPLKEFLEYLKHDRFSGIIVLELSPFLSKAIGRKRIAEFEEIFSQALEFVYSAI